jgi:hypothetical protein
LVTNDTAVLRARYGSTAPKPSGFRGSSPWIRWNAYSPTTEASERPQRAAVGLPGLLPLGGQAQAAVDEALDRAEHRVQEGPLAAHDPGDVGTDGRGQDDHEEQQGERLDQVGDEHARNAPDERGVDEVADQGHRGDEGEQVLPVHDVLRQAFSTKVSQTKLSAASASTTATTTASTRASSFETDTGQRSP